MAAVTEFCRVSPDYSGARTVDAAGDMRLLDSALKRDIYGVLHEVS